MSGRGRMGVLALAAAFAGGVGALGVACSFPDIGYAPSAGGTGASAPTGTGGGTTTGGGGGSGGAAPTTTTGGGGGAGGGGAGGAGGGIPAECDVDGDLEVSVACEGGTDCDDDGDTYDVIADACPGGNDCDDTDAMAHPFQNEYFEVPRQGGGFDYNCDDAEEPEISFVACDNACFSDTNNVFMVEDKPCGQGGVFGDCKGVIGDCEIIIKDNNKLRRCR